MSHYPKRRRFGRSSAHRLSMLQNLAKSLLTHEVIRTTLPKAKDLRGFVERWVTLAKVDSMAHRRRLFAKVQDKALLQALFTHFGPRYLDRPGGYTRILKCGFRAGDAAPMAYIEWV